jgi:hypothetical protein
MKINKKNLFFINNNNNLRLSNRKIKFRIDPRFSVIFYNLVFEKKKHPVEIKTVK